MRLLSRESRRASVLLLAIVLAAMLGAPAGAGASLAADPALVRLVRSDGEGVTLELTAPKAALTSAQAAQAAIAPGCRQLQAAGMTQTVDVGRPQLPVKTVLLGAPAGAALQLDITESAGEILADGVTLCPAMRAADSESGEGAMAGDNGTTAGSPYGFYPAEAVRLVDLGFMRSQRIVRVEFYPYQYNPVTRQVRATGVLRAEVRFGAGATGERVSEPADWERSFRDLLLNYDAAVAFRRSPTAATAAAPAAGWIPPQPGYKIAIKEEGIYHLTRAWLAAGGLPVDSLDPQTFRLFNNQAEVAIRVTGEQDGHLDAGDEVVFYGRGVDSRYTDANVYWLTYGGGVAPVAGRMTSRGSAGGGAAVSSFLTTVKKEDNTTYDSNLPMLPGYDHWFGQQIQAAGAGKSGSVSVALATPLAAAGAGNATVSVMLGAVTMGSHHVRLYINPTTYPANVYDGSWDGATTFLATAEFPQSRLNAAGNNTVKIEIINDFPGRAADIVRLDWAKIAYQRTLAADGDKLLFDGASAGSRRYSVAGFTTTDVDLYDVGDPNRVVLITGATFGEPTNGSKLFLPMVVRASVTTAAQAVETGELAAGAPGASTLQFGDNQATARRYAVWARGQMLTPLSIALDQASSLQAGGNAADYIIVTYGEFAAAVQPLATLHAAQGMRVRVVDVQDIYDEFGGGLMSAEAIRDFTAYAYANWTKPAPAYLLLVGDGTYDFRNYKSSDRTFVPPYLELVDPDAGETATDNRFVAVTADANGYDILPDLHVGRLPANSVAEVTAMVNKILAYEAQAPRPWTKQVLFVSDDLEGGGGDFYAYSDGIADGTVQYNGSQVKILPADYTPNKVYLGRTCDLANPSQSVECRAQIIQQINSGSLMVSYIGHGVKTYWAAERLYDGNSLNSLTNANRLPVMLPMTCNEGYFIDPGEPSLSELGVRAEGKGVIASWSPTGFGLAPGHDYLQRGLFLAVFQEAKPLGSAATSAKLYLVANAAPNTYRDLIDTFLLLGDPALHVK